MIPRQTEGNASDVSWFFAALAITFAAALVVMLPIAALALGLTMLIVAPLMLVVGAFVAAIVSSVLSRLMRGSKRTGRLLKVLLGGEVTALVLLIAWYVLALSSFPIAPLILPVVISAAVIAYRTTALAWLSSDGTAPSAITGKAQDRY